MTTATTTTITGLTRIEDAFAVAKAKGRAALMPYFTAGFPDEPASEAILVAIAQAGADLIELGVPFSDPLADGPVIQYSTQVALEHGMTSARAIRLVQRLRARGVTVPVMLMGYANPIVAYGLERYVRDVAEVGGDGLIVPDLPLEEASDLEAACARQGLALAYLAAPTSPADRLKRIAEHTSGFLYLVSLTGVTGARDSLPSDLGEFVARAKRVAHTPVAVGFGIASPEQAAAVAALADGVIVGSALIEGHDERFGPSSGGRGIRAGFE